MEGPGVLWHGEGQVTWPRQLGSSLAEALEGKGPPVRAGVLLCVNEWGGGGEREETPPVSLQQEIFLLASPFMFFLGVI